MVLHNKNQSINKPGPLASGTAASGYPLWSGAAQQQSINKPGPPLASGTAAFGYLPWSGGAEQHQRQKQLIFIKWFSNDYGRKVRNYNTVAC